MKIFGFELVGLQTLRVKCPKGDHTADLLFYPSKDNSTLPTPAEMGKILKESGLSDFIAIPRHDDLHFLCMKCGISLKNCEVFKKECKIK